jgi:hypothetical protein
LALNASSGSALGGTDSVSVAAGAVLLVASSNQVNDDATITLSGGTIIRGGGASELFGDLVLTDASTLNFGSTSESSFLQFGSLTLNDFTLTVSNFLIGNELRYSAADFAAGAALADTFDFVSSSAFNYSFGEGTFTITAIPETSTTVAAAIVALALGISCVRRRRQVAS